MMYNLKTWLNFCTLIALFPFLVLICVNMTSSLVLGVNPKQLEILNGIDPFKRPQSRFESQKLIFPLHLTASAGVIPLTILFSVTV